MRHLIRIDSDQPGHHYAVSGAVSIPSSPTPIQDAARALRAAGAQDSDIVAVSGGHVTILPSSIAAILREREAPRSFAAPSGAWEY